MQEANILAQKIDRKQISGQRYLWSITLPCFNKVKSLSAETNLSLPISQVLLNRGFDSKQKVLEFLFPVLDVAQDDYLSMKGAACALTRLKEAIKNKHKILIFGDYDVDGMTATSIALLCLKKAGAVVNYYLPNRVRDGYGLSAKIVESAKKNDYHLILTVDNGTTCFDAANKAQELGIDLIITDHHKPKGELPVALALINPHQVECGYRFKDFCGAGVVFKLMSFLLHDLNLDIPDKVYELLMMGTVADVVPLVGENRYWVMYGLERLNNKNQSFSFKCLANNAGKINKSIWLSADIGFGIAPQLNALGRLDDPKAAVRFLIGSDEQEILSIADKLKEINLRRRDVESVILTQISEKILSNQIDLSKEFFVTDYSTTWQAGVIGLVAGRITAAYGRPCLLFFDDQASGLLKGSARSIQGFDLFKALSKCSDLLTSFGGHPMAAGLALQKDKFIEFKNRFSALIAAQYKIADLVPKIEIDAELVHGDLNARLYQDLSRIEPFGNANPSPIFLIKGVICLEPPIVLKEKHLKILCQVGTYKRFVMFFYAANLLPFFEKIQNSPFDLVAQFALNDFFGSAKFDLHGLDVGLSEYI